jgi:hypothetical protein
MLFDLLKYYFIDNAMPGRSTLHYDCPSESSF